ncbi:sodium:solute symporter family protein [Salidesulfovibrio onnuriiensis]|uniref:sodium:solute symporter family protein n=1 Tax=Salidesulfovibrio onnuriiensis TaxID=2583823 RepID=UPI0011C6FA4D|nr:sodium:solute symporter family protein [Salidesulfovibrio onnuriiensis]
MHTVDYFVLALYFCTLLVIGFRANKRHKDVDDYYVGGRKVGVLSLAALWMSSWVGGAAIVGSAEKSYQVGISALWYALSIFIGFLLFALTCAARIKELGDTHKHITYPDLIEERYDSRTRIVSTLTTVAAYLGYIAGQLIAAAHIIAAISGQSLGISFVVATTVTVLYTSMGGFFAVETTDKFQSLLVLGGITLVTVPLTWNYMGGIERLVTELPADFYDWGNWGWGTILAMVTSMVLTFFTSMDSFTRCYAASSCKAARKGTLYAALAALVISCSICFLGMSSRVIFPDGTGAPGGASALIGLIMHVLPVGIKGLLLVAILSAIMSTADTCILCASSNLTSDIYHRYINPAASRETVLRLSIASSICVGVAGALIGWFFKDIMSILVMAFTFNSAGLFFPTMAVFFWKRATSSAAFWSMSASLCTVSLWYIGQGMDPENTWFAIDPVWPGLLVSAVSFIALTLMASERCADTNLQPDNTLV